MPSVIPYDNSTYYIADHQRQRLARVSWFAKENDDLTPKLDI